MTVMHQYYVVPIGNDWIAKDNFTHSRLSGARLAVAAVDRAVSSMLIASAADERVLSTLFPWRRAKCGRRGVSSHTIRRVRGLENERTTTHAPAGAMRHTFGRR